MSRRPTDRQIVSHLLAFVAGLAVAYFAIPALKAPVVATEQVPSLQRFRSIAATPPVVARNAPRIETPAQSDLSGRLIIPVQGVLKKHLVDTYTQARAVDRQHNAIDIMAPEATPILAGDDGIVEKLHQSAAGGITLYQFNTERTYSFYYAHLNSYAPGLTEGQLVRKGDVIGYVGHTGNASPDGPHLHFQINALAKDAKWSDGYSLNPYPILMNAPQ